MKIRKRSLRMKNHPVTPSPISDPEQTEIDRLNQRIAQLEQENSQLKHHNAELEQEMARLAQTLEAAEHARDRYQYVLMNLVAGVNISLGADFRSELANPNYLQIVGR